MDANIANFDLDGMNFVAQENTGRGEVSAETLFEYHQKNDLVWATYSGGDIVYGQLLGHYISGDSFTFCYQHLNTSNHLMTGKCVTNIWKDAQCKITLDET